jgi:hypothetical protein
MMRKNLRGELTEPKSTERHSLSNNPLVMSIAHELKADDFADIKEIGHAVVPMLVNAVAKAVSFIFLFCREISSF